MTVLRVSGGQVMDDADCSECGDAVDRVFVYQLGSGADAHHTTLCAECLARALDMVSGFRFRNQLAAWRATRATHERIRAEKLARRGRRDVSPLANQ